VAFDESGISVTKEVNAAKETLKGDAVWDVIGDAEKVYVTSGKKILEYDPGEADREEVLKRVTGRTGNLRAPTLRRGRVLYVGYNDELYGTLIRE